MLDRLAIVVVGEQNSGKTSTLLQYSDYYNEPVGTFRKGWRYRITPYRPKFETVKVWGYFLPGSPTETRIPLSHSIFPKTMPDLLLMAEQLNGNEYSNTMHYLMTHNFQIKVYTISNIIGDGIWDRWEKGDAFREQAKLLQRREEIADYIRKFIISKCAI
jgi:GTPase SAR1 family protein